MDYVLLFVLYIYLMLHQHSEDSCGSCPSFTDEGIEVQGGKLLMSHN